MIRRISYAVGSLAAAGLFLSPVRAAISGFGNFTNFTINQNDAASPPTEPTSGALELVTGDGEQRSIFYDTPQNVTQFTASFTYQGDDVDSGGFALVVQNDPKAAGAVGTYNPYVEECGFYPITKSVGITFDMDDNGTGLYTVTSKSFSTTYLVLTSIPTTVGGSTAIVGITADSGGGTQTFSNFQFTNSAPEPASLSLIVAGGMLAVRRRRR